MSALIDVRDLDCIVSFAPLAFDLTAREVQGAAAVLRRIIYRWCLRKGTLLHAPDEGVESPLLDLEGGTFDALDLDGLRAALEREAADEDFVASARVSLSLAGDGSLLVTAAITLVDGITYPLEVIASDARIALRALGAAA